MNKFRKIFIITVMVIAPTAGFSQMVVVDPAANALLGILNSTQQATNGTLQGIQTVLEVMQKVQEKMKDANFIKKLETVEKVYKTMDALLCQIDEMTLAATASASAQSCFINMRISITMLNTNISSDLMKMVVMSSAMTKTEVTAGDRMKMLNDVCDNIEKACIQMHSITVRLNKATVAEIKHKIAVAQIDEELEYEFAKR